MYLKICLKFKLIMLVSMFGIIGCVHSKDDSDIKIAMLKEFYIAYNTAWESELNAKQLIHKLDSLKQQYCSKSYRSELQEMFDRAGLDHDLLIGDITANMDYLNDITIIEDDMRENWFVVSYIGYYSDINDKQVKVKVNLRVEIIKEEGRYRINNVEIIR